MNKPEPKVLELLKPDGYWYETFAGWSFCNAASGRPGGKKAVIDMFALGTVRQALEARDIQWIEMLSKQEPAAYVVAAQHEDGSHQGHRLEWKGFSRAAVA
jgi:hypothetical protein